MNQKAIIIQGSANSNGNTHKVVSHINKITGITVVDLKTKNIAQFDYEFKNIDDDFIPLIEEIVHNYQLIIFATPVYWYAMSGIMKKFFDRISDCLIIKKEIGRKLKGKQMAVICCGANKELKSEFYMPFIETANYLGMEYIGNIYIPFEYGKAGAFDELEISNFIKILTDNDLKN